jgi:hypothetical protein
MSSSCRKILGDAPTALASARGQPRETRRARAGAPRAVATRMHRWIVVLACVAGCPDRTISKVQMTEHSVIRKDIATSAMLDLLLVIDNSSSTGDKQDLFAQNIAGFAAALENLPGGVKPNVHIGVVSSTVGLGTDAFASGNCPAVGDDGRFIDTPRVATGCLGPTGSYITDDGMGTTNLPRNGQTLAQTLSCIAQLGENGCGFEAQLEAMKLALDGSQPGNLGFVRDGAYLAVVILTDEDDCSVKEHDPSLFERTDLSRDDFRGQPLYAYTCDEPIAPNAPGSYTSCKPRTDSYLEPPAFYYSFLAGLKPNHPEKVIVGVIGGDPTPNITTGPVTFANGFTQPLALQPSSPKNSCTINGHAAIARPGIRLADLASRFGDHGLFEQVCQPDYSGVVADIGQVIAASVSPCLEGAIDLSAADPQNPTAGMPCTVTANDQVIAPCTMATPTMPAPGVRPCWWVEANPASCSAPTEPTHLELHVEQPPQDAVFSISCALTPT